MTKVAAMPIYDKNLYKSSSPEPIWRKYVHEVLVNRLGGLSLPRKSVVRLTDRPDMTLDVYRGRKTTIQPTNQPEPIDRWPWNLVCSIRYLSTTKIVQR